MSENIPRRAIPQASSEYPGRHPFAAPEARQAPGVKPNVSTYSAGTSSTSNRPSGATDGLELPVGRVWAEAYSVTTSDAAATVEVSLIATAKGVRAHVRSRAAGTTISGGSIRFWVLNPVSLEWALGGVDEALQTGAQEVATTDQFVTVGAP